MKKTIIIIRSNPVNPDSRVEKEAKALSRYGYKIHILAWDRETSHANETSVFDKKYNILITRIGEKASYGEGMKNILSYLRFQYRMKKWLVKNRASYDAIHACDFDTAFTSSFIARKYNKKFVFDIFDFIFGNPQTLLQKIIKREELKLIDFSDATIICSEDRKRQIQGSFPKCLVVLHNSPEKIKDQKITVNNKHITVAYVGILQDGRLLKEIAEYFEDNPEYNFNIAGFGKYEEFFSSLSHKYNNIHYFGKINYSDTLALENKADIMTAIYDPKIENHKYAAPNKFYEALMLGKPLIMVKNTGMSNEVEKNNIGVLIEYSETGFAKGFQELINKKDEWPEMSKRMKKIYDDKYSWSKMEKRLTTLYDGIFKGQD